MRRALAGHTIDTLYEQGWATLTNGRLLMTAEQAGYELFVTTDQNLRYQQNVQDRRLAILVLSTTWWPHLRQQMERIQVAIDGSSPGAYREM
ncbi:MAG: hypothetical protein NVSMB22_23200 [Chloroflexota bacterium]